MARRARRWYRSPPWTHSSSDSKARSRSSRGLVRGWVARRQSASPGAARVSPCGGGGAIINVTTIGGKTPLAKALPTSLTRAAGINLTKSLSKEYAADQIRVNTICLGVVKSAQWTRRFKGGDLNAFYADMAKARGVPLGRLGEAEEFADLVAFLASERAKWITGTAINFDGGAAAAV